MLDERFAPPMLLATKLSPPAARGGFVPRSALIGLLDSGRSAKLAVVCAPTGSGKTSLLAEWAARAPGRFAWLSLDRGDDEPLRFWRYVVAALATVAPEAAQGAERRLSAPVVSIADEVLPVLVNDFAMLPDQLVLVLDDFHLLNNGDVPQQLGYLLDRLPRQLRLVVASQTDPPLRLGRLRALGDLFELRAEELRFSEAEAAQLLNGLHHLGLAPEDVSALARRTEGWVAGLNLAALSLKQGVAPRSLQDVPSEDRFLTDYLWEEVVLAQPPAVRRFMMRTSILERMCGSLCDAVVSGSDSAEMLRWLASANLFVIALDPGREWFRYHQLFRSLLHEQLRRFGPDLIPDLHRRASTWYADHGLVGEAIEHAIAGGDVHWAADELERQWLGLYSAGHATTLLDWIDRLPEEAVLARPVIALVRAGVARAQGRFNEVEPWLARAERAAPDAPAPGMASSVAGGVAAVRSALRLAFGDLPEAIRWGREALALEPDPRSREHATACYWLAMALVYWDIEGARALLVNYLAVVPPGEDDIRRYFAMALLAEMNALAGEFEAATRLAEDAFAVARQRGLVEHPPTNQVHIALAAVSLARADLEEAEEHVERAAVLSGRGGDRMQCAHALVWFARVRARQGDSVAARSALEQARELVPQLGTTVMCAQIALLEDELPDAPSRQPTAAEAGDPLSDAELRILRLLVTDLSYREIGEQLHLSINTVRSHTYRIRRKLGAVSRAETVAKARGLGVL